MLALKIAETKAGAGYGARGMTFGAYAQRWIERHLLRVRPSTMRVYRSRLESQILPELAAVPLCRLTRLACREFLIGKQRAGFASSTITAIHGLLSIILASAGDEGLIPQNAAAGARRGLGLAKTGRVGSVKAFTSAQLRTFLLASQREGAIGDLLALMALSGIRSGEAMALDRSDVDLAARKVRIERTATRANGIQRTKSGRDRFVDLSAAAVTIVSRHLDGSRAPGTLFEHPEAAPYSHEQLAAAFSRILQAAELPLHHTPHSLRHTYASLLLADGVTPVYVKEQLGHSSIQITVDTYGGWIRARRPAALNGLGAVLEASGRGSKVVAIASARGRLCGRKHP